MPCELRSERRYNALILTFDNEGKHEGLSEQLFAAGVEALNVAESDPGVRCVILQGNAEQFCAGGSVTPLDRHGAANTLFNAQLSERFDQFLDCVRACPKPVIAAVEGQAMDIGFSLTLACDLVVAADSATFSISRGVAGFSPGSGAIQQLVRVLPRPILQQLIWLGEPISARQLHSYGFVNWVIESGKALVKACLVAERLAQAEQKALASAKELVNQGVGQAPTRQPTQHSSHLPANLSYP